MALPAGWPPRPASGRRSIRFCVQGTASGSFADNAYFFVDGAGANTFTPTPYVRPGSTDPVAVGDIAISGSPMGGRRIPEDVAPREHDNPPTTQEESPVSLIWSSGIVVINLSIVAAEILEISFDGVNVHGVVPAGETRPYQNRYEAGIAVRTQAGTPEFVVEAW